MSEWRLLAIDKLGTIVTGSTPPKKHAEWFGNEVDFITPTDLSTDGRRPSPARGLSTTGVKNLRSRLLPPGAVCFTCIASIGKMCLTLSPAVTNQQINSIIVDPDVADARFVYYLLRNEAERIGTFASGAATPIINKSTFSAIEVGLPALSTQEAIAEILGSIDDLIENNRRRIEILEEMAQAIYREWFVHFRFPGHETASFIDSPLGPIPENWEATTLGDCSSNFDRLRKPMSKMERAARPGPFPYYGAAKLIDWVDDWIFDGEYLLFAEDGSVQTEAGYPVLQLLDSKFWPNNHTHILRGSSVSTRFLYLACQRQPIGAFVTGAAQPKITQANLNRVPIVRPDERTLEEFASIVDPLLNEWRTLQRKNTPLGAVRNLLLPKLVSGEIDVSDLDLDVAVEGAV